MNKFFTRFVAVAALMFASFAGTAWADSVTFNFEQIAGTENWSNATAYTSVSVTPITITASGGGNNGKYYTSDKTWRMYSDGSLSITAASGYSITAVSSNPSKTFTVAAGAASLSLTATTKFKSITVEYSASNACQAPTFSPAAGTFTSAQNVAISTTTDGARIYYTTDETTPTTSSSLYSAAIPVSTTTTIKAIAVKDGMNNSSVASATYTILAHAGTEADPYDVATARAAIDASVGINGVYATGIVSQVLQFNSTNGYISYNISSDGSTNSNQLQAYHGKGIGGANFTSEDDIQVGDVVVIKGDLKKYNTTYEFYADNQLVTLDRPEHAIISTTPSELSDFEYLAGYGPSAAQHFSVSGTNLTENISLSLEENSKFEISLSEDSGFTNSLTLTQNAGSVDNGTVYVRLKADQTAGNYNSTITLSSATALSKTVTLSGSIKAVASLPFAYDSNGEGTASIAGFSQSGLSNYSSAPKIKFDDEGDYLILAFGEAPGILTYDIKGNSFSGGTFKVQSSTDGQTYTDVKTYTTLDNDNKQSEIINNLSSDVRFIKWVYTNRSSGNVGLGNISLAKLSAGISLSNYTINVPTAGANETLDVVYTLVDFTVAPEIIWCDVNGASASQPAWFDADINPTTHNVEYIADANTGAARSTYFKIYGLDSSANDVYSSVITVNQAAASYATLPFAFDGGKSDIASKAGLTSSGLGSDYGASPRLKFDDADDYVILQVNEAIDILSFDIKGNSYSSSSIFKVQTSVDGTNYTDLKTYTELDATQTEVLTNLSSDVRYIKWIYSNKASGNVALGNIKAAKITQLTGTLNEGRYWTTFFNGSCRYTLSEGAHAFTMNASHQLYQLGTDGSVIPAGTPVIIISDTADIALTQSSDTTAVTVNGETNILSGSDSSVAVSGITGTPYVMGIVGGVLGFYQFNGTEVPAAKAYISE